MARAACVGAGSDFDSWATFRTFVSGTGARTRTAGADFRQSRGAITEHPRDGPEKHNFLNGSDA
jgi:hypothetical protein